MGLRGQSTALTAGKNGRRRGRNDQCCDHSAPSSIHFRSSRICSGASRFPVRGGGMRSSGSSAVTRSMSALVRASPGTMTFLRSRVRLSFLVEPELGVALGARLVRDRRSSSPRGSAGPCRVKVNAEARLEPLRHSKSSSTSTPRQSRRRREQPSHQAVRAAERGRGGGHRDALGGMWAGGGVRECRCGIVTEGRIEEDPRKLPFSLARIVWISAGRDPVDPVHGRVANCPVVFRFSSQGKLPV